MTQIIVKRGDTVRWNCTWRAEGQTVDLTGFELHSEVRTSKGVLVAELEVELLDQTTHRGQFTLYYESTEDWTVGDHLCDIRVKQPDGDFYPTESFTVTVVAGVTERW